MKKLFSFLISMVLVFCCYWYGNTQKEVDPYVYMSTRVKQECTYEQFDSLCTEDHISGDLDKWDSTIFVDYNNKRIKRYIYVTKKSGEKDTTTTYSVTPNDSTVFVNKCTAVKRTTVE